MAIYLFSTPTSHPFAIRLAERLGTDTHPHHQLVEQQPKFEVVSVAGLFADVVARLVS